jgi:Ca2+-binding EF-hand superfamily protein
MRRPLISGHNNNRHLATEELDNNIGGLPVTEPKLRELFDSLDVNRNGVLEFNEVKKLYKNFDNYGLEYTDAEIENHLRKVAKSTDNMVSFDEFCCIVLNLAQR